MSNPLDRYRLITQLLVPDPAAGYWRAFDTALDREVVIRILDASDPRAAALNRDARAAASVQDRRLGQVLDVIDVPADGQTPARIAVVNEWITGESLLSVMANRQWEPLSVQRAIGILTEVAQALELAHERRVRHGRLLPENVLLTDAAEVRVIGMAIDAVVLGAPQPDLIRSDIDALGGLLYFLLTGRSPFVSDRFRRPALAAPIAPRHRSHLEPASHVRADIPHELDVLISRSMFELQRPRGTTRIRTVSEFLSALTQVQASLDPVPSRPSTQRAATLGLRVVIGLAVVAGLALLVVAWRQLYIGPDVKPARSTPSASQSPSDHSSVRTASVAVPIAAAHSYDPFGDDNRDGLHDGTAGREHERQAVRAIDNKPSTGWNSVRYAMANANGKGGVGLVLDLGTEQAVDAVDLVLGDVGAAVQIGVAPLELGDPAQWAVLARAPAGKSHVALRSPRAITGRYVLVWFPLLPPSLTHPDMHQVRVSEVVVHARR